jgi:V/A-type H+-transporting ATPase subunit F
LELGVLGDAEFCLGFRLVGIRFVFEVEEGEDVDEAVQMSMAVPEVGILVLPSGLLGGMRPSTRAALTASVRPVAIPIGADESTDLREKIKQAVGVDLWAKEGDARRKGKEQRRET